MKHLSVVSLLATGEHLVGGGVRAFEPVLEELIRGADREIQIAAYRFDASAVRFLELIQEALLRGVRATVVLSSSVLQPEVVVQRLRRLEEYSGVRVVDFRNRSGRLLHAKVLVADRRRAVVGSANFTWGGMVENYEIGVLLEGEIVWQLARLIDRMACI